MREVGGSPERKPEREFFPWPIALPEEPTTPAKSDGSYAKEPAARLYVGISDTPADPRPRVWGEILPPAPDKDQETPSREELAQTDTAPLESNQAKPAQEVSESPSREHPTVTDQRESESAVSRASRPTTEPQEQATEADHLRAETVSAERGKQEPELMPQPASDSAEPARTPSEPADAAQPTHESPKSLPETDRLSATHEWRENPLKQLEQQAEKSDAARQAAADEFIQDREAMLRQLLLAGPVATLVVETREDRDRLIMQIHYFATEQKHARDLARDLTEAYLEAGGEKARSPLLEMLRAAQTQESSPAWIGELIQEVMEGFVEKAVSEVACEALATALAIILAIPTGPISALAAAGLLLRAARY